MLLCLDSPALVNFLSVLPQKSTAMLCSMADVWAMSVAVDSLRSCCWPLAAVSDEFAAAALFRTRYFSASDVVVDEVSTSQSCTALYCVLNGTVEVTAEKDDAPNVIPYKVVTGQCCGALAHGDRRLTLLAPVTTRNLVSALERTDLDALMERLPEDGNAVRALLEEHALMATASNLARLWKFDAAQTERLGDAIDELTETLSLPPSQTLPADAALVVVVCGTVILGARDGVKREVRAGGAFGTSASHRVDDAAGGLDDSAADGMATGVSRTVLILLRSAALSTVLRPGASGEGKREQAEAARQKRVEKARLKREADERMNQRRLAKKCALEIGALRKSIQQFEVQLYGVASTEEPEEPPEVDDLDEDSVMRQCQWVIDQHAPIVTEGITIQGQSYIGP